MTETEFTPRIFSGGEAHEVLPKIFLGSKDAASDRESLKIHGVTHILTVNGMEPKFPEEFTYRVIKMGGEGGGISEHLGECLSFVEEGSQVEGGVLVHCTHGTGRSGAMAIAVAMKDAGLHQGRGTIGDFATAFRLVKSRRPGTDPPLSYQQELAEWERRSNETVSS